MTYKLQLMQGKRKPVLLDTLGTAETAVYNGAAYLGLTMDMKPSIDYLYENGHVEMTVGRAGQEPETILIEVEL